MAISTVDSKSLKSAKSSLDKVIDSYSEVIIGQDNMIEKMLIAFINDGNILIEGVPGLAKTIAIKTMAQLSGLNFSRIQFTPDLLPADILGTEIYNQSTGRFYTKKGPLFSNIILADEINRAPSKVQSALLEAMQEKQITIGDKTFPLDNNYMVLATQNPMDQEGTYPLPEAQMDRFLFKILVDYPQREDEIAVVKQQIGLNKFKNIKAILTKSKIEELKKVAGQIYIDDKILEYILSIVEATRNPEKYGLNSDYINFGASPRASISLAKAARANALLQGDDFVKSDDIKDVAFEVLRHRILISYEAEAENIKVDDIIREILDKVSTP